ncbi:MAG: sigma-E factor negative regulatory protein [Thermoflexales bacterium]
METHEMVSALADGQLRGDALSRGIEVVATDPQARLAWQNYHLIGDVLRSGELSIGTPAATFLARFQVLIEREQELGRPAEAPAIATGAGEAPAVVDRAPAANDGSFRWKLVAGFASLAAITALSWSAVGELTRVQQPQLASAAPLVRPAPAQRAPVMIRDPRLDEMLAAHRQFGGGASALQTPAGFLRNATFEVPSR